MAVGWCCSGGTRLLRRGSCWGWVDGIELYLVDAKKRRSIKISPAGIKKRVWIRVSAGDVKKRRPGDDAEWCLTDVAWRDEEADPAGMPAMPPPSIYQLCPPPPGKYLVRGPADADVFGLMLDVRSGLGFVSTDSLYMPRPGLSTYSSCSVRRMDLSKLGLSRCLLRCTLFEVENAIPDHALSRDAGRLNGNRRREDAYKRHPYLPDNYSSYIPQINRLFQDYFILKLKIYYVVEVLMGSPIQ